MIMIGFKLLGSLAVFLCTITGSHGQSLIPRDQWHCGAQNYPESVDFSYNFAKDNCFNWMADANKCCEVHDECYIYHSQEHCDSKFCACLNTMAKTSGHNDCQDVSDFFCLAVGLFGSSAWQAANQNASSSTPTSTTTVTAKTTTPVTTTTAKTTEKEEKKVMERQHTGHLDIHLYCFEHGVDTCITKFQECATIAHLLGHPDPHCKRDFCSCSSHELLPDYENPSENFQLCRQHLGHFCHDHPMPNKPENPDRYNVHFWSIHISYFDITLSLSTIIVVFSLIVLAIVSAVWFYRRRRTAFMRLNSTASSLGSENSSSEQVNSVHHSKHVLPISWVRTNCIKDSASSQALIQEP